MAPPRHATTGAGLFFIGGAPAGMLAAVAPDTATKARLGWKAGLLAAPQRPIGRGSRYAITVWLCSRMNCGTYQGPRPPFPVTPEPFQPQKVWMPGQAPVVAPLARLA